MSGFFYAYASEATARAAKPDWFTQNGLDGTAVLAAPRTVVSTKGLLVTPNILSDPDPDTGEQTLIEAGEMSQPYVILSPTDDGSPSKRITPVNHQGFA